MPESAIPKFRSTAPPMSAQTMIFSPPCAQLDVTSNFSFLRGASHPDELVYRAAESGCAAVAITDLNSLAGVVRAHQAAKDAGIRLCVGARLQMVDAPDVLVWAASRDGYANLCRLLTSGKRRAEKGQCTLKLSDLLAACDGLIAALVPQGIEPQLPIADPTALAQAAGALKDAMGNRLSLAISRVHDALDCLVLGQGRAVSRACDIPLLATNAVHYHDAHRRMLQDVLCCVRHGCTIQEAGFRLFCNGERFLKTPPQMHELFRDLPGAIRRGVQIAEQCEFSLDELKYEYPDEIVPPGKTPAAYLAELAWAGAAERYPAGLPQSVRSQIQHELELIAQLKIEPYFLTVYDLVRFARSRGILCQGRGSAANSAVCYCIGVTSVDPARVDLLFERFVSAARNEPPDIDIDFEHERREEVIQYVYQKYGRDRAAMTAEVITYRGRSAVRDVGKALGLGLDTVDQMAKRLDWWDSGKLTAEKISQIGLDPDDSTVRLVIALAGELLGFPRHLSQHVGGMVMCRRPLDETVPIENAAMDERTVIEWDKDDIDAVGMLKVDVLGLGMLTAIAKAMKLVSDARPTEPPIQLHTIPAEDPQVYEMVSDADTVGVFQIESRAQMSMLPRLRPKTFYDLVIEVAIVRPGPIQGNMVHPYLRRRDGLEPVCFPSKALESVLGKTLGVPLFQEQAMKIAMVAAGFSADEADRLRRAMASWRYNGTIEQFHRKIVDGMIANGYDESFAQQCFEQIRGFGEYGFPESHAASFALLVYASSWLKRYHPAAFCAALLNSQPMGFYAPAQIVRDAADHGVTVHPVDVNHSEWDCTLETLTPSSGAPEDFQSPSPGTPGEGWGEGDFTKCDKGPSPCPSPGVPGEGKSWPLPGDAPKRAWGVGGPAVRLGFRMIKGLHAAHGQRIAECCREVGQFTSVDHLHRAADLPINAMAKLAEADAFGSLQKTRRPAMWEMLALPRQRSPLEMPHVESEAAPMLPHMSMREEILADYGTTSLSLKGHPVAIVREELTRRRIIPASQTWKYPAGRYVRVAGLVLIRQRPGTASGIVFVTLEDESGIVNLIVRPAIYEQYRAAARYATLLAAEGRIERQGQVQHVMTVRMHDLSELLSGYDSQSRDFR
jgi:error-prone DNA polymerase